MSTGNLVDITDSLVLKDLRRAFEHTDTDALNKAQVKLWYRRNDINCKKKITDKEHIILELVRALDDFVMTKDLSQIDPDQPEEPCLEHRQFIERAEKSLQFFYRKYREIIEENK